MSSKQYDARTRLHDIRSSIYEKWEHHETHVIACLDTPGRDRFHGACDALLDMDEALRSVWNGLPKEEALAKLAAYGFLQALVVQQDATLLLSDLVLPELGWKPWKVPELLRIRVLRHRLSGHVAYAKDSGRTASIIDVRDRTLIAGTIYGLADDEKDGRFPREPIQSLVIANAIGLLPVLQEVDGAFDHPTELFNRLRSR